MTTTDCECLASLRSCFPFTPRLLSTGNAIFLFCQAAAGLCDCLCDLRLFCSLIFQDVVALCFHVLLLHSLLGRNEVTKLKFEGRTFHIYANQREVRA